MNIEALDRAAIIEAVTTEVIKRLGQGETDEPAVPKKQAVLLTVSPVPELESMLDQQYEVRYYDESLRDCDVLIVPKLCLQLLSNLANGISAGPRERFVLTMLLKGRKVVAIKEGLLYRKYKSTAPVLLYKLYDEFADRLNSYGIRVVKEQELLATCMEDGRAAAVAQVDRSSESVDAPLHPEVLNRKVITEAELKKYRLQNGKEIVIDRHSIITPLAQDYLRMQQMQVHRR
ncbi:ethanolamine utilization protein [Paenibacillus apiarius]|uniref:Ethanolamine utilization protein n=1 Tax=Paenibacillus apiarius TaxID=46240 RepID=A0ABT4E0W2_9BACL|nr:ethanolamine utilization protein [Paenibacillus apiarius]MCY9517048.1 ethanolamine utilization protein [Paenibacillus apiarius]MCY9523244.1 ethanolamine utilization protein [Paenibacillus apiarius]MCY9554258.1 ethanolamine utilization protein [Paenibacillus apiarius]MCY9560869.1 ethanolamine utilization protein [Paenibacillus apiarius]MCY9682790.1 ethanolamine utilization protein [Paenibacillus apiarius]